MAGVSPSAKTFTPKQGQYLAYIHLYTRLHRRPPAEADIQQYFQVTPPSVHQMVVTLERAGFILGAEQKIIEVAGTGPATTPVEGPSAST